MCFNEDWRYQFTRANKFCLLELIKVAKGHLDELQKAKKYPHYVVVIGRFHCIKTNLITLWH